MLMSNCIAPQIPEPPRQRESARQDCCCSLRVICCSLLAMSHAGLASTDERERERERLGRGGEMGEAEAKYQKSYFDVLGICCPSEVPLVEKLLEPLDGVQKVTVIVPSRTVIVVHDASAISQSQIVKALNQARLEASVRAYGSGTEKITNKWPSPYVLVCGVFWSCLCSSISGTR